MFVNTIINNANAIMFMPSAYDCMALPTKKSTMNKSITFQRHFKYCRGTMIKKYNGLKISI